ncbi:MAG: DUF2497 domain-containing protein [Hyphomicrobiales bacterium]|nr:DUF2497 domain-containing protein [Hyphomicrobiales bacterium]
MPSHHQPVLDPSTNSLPEPRPNTQKPSVLVERREYLETKLDSDPLIQSVRPELEISDPVIKPANPGVPLATVKPPADSSAPKAPDNQSSSLQHDQYRNNDIPGFVEDKPNINGIQDSAAKTPQTTETTLHPAIANAKSFVGIQDYDNKNNSVSNQPETPVFTGAPPPSVTSPMESLISPDGDERRLIDERRNHPLRRGADRVENVSKNDLMSVQTNDSVHNSFEQLKKMTTENLDSDVKEMIRPMLREWLDNNLPSMVERLVRDEIERVSRGG